MPKAPMEHQARRDRFILLTARFWGGTYVWYSHPHYDRVPPRAAFIDAMAAGKVLT